MSDESVNTVMLKFLERLHAEKRLPCADRTEDRARQLARKKGLAAFERGWRITAAGEAALDAERLASADAEESAGKKYL